MSFCKKKKDNVFAFYIHCIDKVNFISRANKKNVEYNWKEEKKKTLQNFVRLTFEKLVKVKFNCACFVNSIGITN